MPLIVIAFLSGILTALAPCVLPVVPAILGGSVSNQDKKRPYIVVASLFVSIILFTLLLRASTALIGIPDWFWKYLSGGIVIFFGLTLVFPLLWDKLTNKINLYGRSQRLLGSANRVQGYEGSILIGFSLGPVFTSCSPVYIFILSTVLPQNFSQGVILISAYALGLCLVLLAVGVFGQSLIHKFQWATNPYGLFKRTIGLLLVVAGLMIITGLDKKLQQFVIDKGLLDITRVERQLLQ